MIDPLLANIGTQTFAGLMTNLISNYAARMTRSLPQAEATITTDLRNHIQNTYEKCRTVKTIINDEPIDTLSIYVDQKFRSQNNTLDQYSLIDEIRSGKSAVITGYGGGGKSMFMRYLWLSYFVHSQGHIPVFFELRNMNQLTHDSIIDYIYHTIIQSRSNISQSQITNSIASGEIILFLDGFDEVSVDKRDWVEQELIKLKENNQNLTIVLTSRPDDRFSGWPQFFSYQVEPLSEKQVIDLINKAHYEQTPKRKFLKRIEGGLYDTHKSFLSNPLLAYMMLLTISKNPDIPNKMHLFYEQAFDALYHRHDTTSKAGYVRRKHCNIDKQAFVRILSYFCLITYHDEHFEFDENSIHDYINKSIRFEGNNLSASSFLSDLTESICVIKKDGTTYDFVHRSFQEYFSALCVCWIANRNLDKLLINFAGRRNDQVLRMVYDINPDLFREKYIVPIKNRYKKFFSSENKILVSERYMGMITGEFRALERKIEDSTEDSIEDRVIVTFFNSGEFSTFCSSIIRIGNEEYNALRDASSKDVGRGDKEFFIKLSKNLGCRINDLRVNSDGRRILASVVGTELEPVDVSKSFRKTYMWAFLKRQSEFVHSRVCEEAEKYKAVTSSFMEYFGE